ncbi:MAG TPA: DUF433 domain-containing protein [Thermoanaerobaculia bacterium]|nr:DUF433 domain-containing protein [Thermoanaerobaculia bacterium]
MAEPVRAIQVPSNLEREIEREAEQRGKSWSATTVELLEEAIRMRRVPGISFSEGPAGRRAGVAGSGLDVWEVVATWRQVGQDLGRLRQEYPWLTEPQLRAALTYYELYPGEIDARLAREEEWTPAKVSSELARAKQKGPRQG